jgi:predicted lipoprotein with Yx(FWY)xxD motif
MRSIRLTLGAAAALAAASCAAIASAATPAAHRPAAHRPAARVRSTAADTLSVVDTAHGKLLANAAGVVVYVFSRDRSDHDACAQVSGCLKDWPPMTVSGAIRVGPGVKRSAVGTITVGHVKQLTYDGHPLYRWRFSTGATGFVSSIGIKAFGGVWDALTTGDTRVR